MAYRQKDDSHYSMDGQQSCLHANQFSASRVCYYWKKATKIDIPCPIQVIRYMGDVDRNDQLRQYYMVRLKSRRYIFWYLFELAVTNSYIVYKGHNGEATNFTLGNFRLDLAKQLNGNYNSRKAPGHPATQPARLLPHHPVKNRTQKRHEQIIVSTAP